MSFIDLPYTLEVYSPETGEDEWGDELPVSSHPPADAAWRSVAVAGWSIDPVEESTGDAVLRTIDRLSAHFPPETAPDAADWIRLPDGSVWRVEGNPGTWEHSPFGFNPGLVQVTATQLNARREER